MHLIDDPTPDEVAAARARRLTGRLEDVRVTRAPVFGAGGLLDRTAARVREQHRARCYGAAYLALVGAVYSFMVYMIATGQDANATSNGAIAALVGCVIVAVCGWKAAKDAKEAGNHVD